MVSAPLSTPSNQHKTRRPVSEPPSRCERHIEDDPGFPCGACGQARRENEEWHRVRILAAQEAERYRVREHARLRALDIEQCDLCDRTGYVRGYICNHDPDAPERAKRGAELCRKELP